MSNIIPIFGTHFGLRSILTLEEKGKSKVDGPDSIIDIALENNLKEVFIADETMSGCIEAYKNLEAANIELTFGLKLNVCPDLNEKTSESVYKTHKIIVWIEGGEQGYHDLIKIHNLAHTKGFYSDRTERFTGARIDYRNLQELWTENLDLSIPFYDSYIYTNLLERGQCIPDFGQIKPNILIESNDLPFDMLIQNAIETAADPSWPRVNVKTIYYKNRDDFDAYLTFRAIQKRQTYAKPNLEFMGSREFCVESWKEQNGI